MTCRIALGFWARCLGSYDTHLLVTDKTRFDKGPVLSASSCEACMWPHQPNRRQAILLNQCLGFVEVLYPSFATHMLTCVYVLLSLAGMHVALDPMS